MYSPPDVALLDIILWFYFLTKENLQVALDLIVREPFHPHHITQLFSRYSCININHMKQMLSTP
jgi:hypothetical protein